MLARGDEEAEGVQFQQEQVQDVSVYVTDSGAVGRITTVLGRSESHPLPSPGRDSRVDTGF